MKSNLLHARFWKYTGESPEGQDHIRYDPHGFGLVLISAMAYHAENKIIPLDGVVINHHKGDQFGHQVHVTATQEQWDAVKKIVRG